MTEIGDRVYYYVGSNSKEGTIVELISVGDSNYQNIRPLAIVRWDHDMSSYAYEVKHLRFVKPPDCVRLDCD